MNPVRVLPLAVIFVLGSCYPESDLQPESVVTPSDCGARERIDAQVKNQALLDFASVGKRCEPFAIQTFVQNAQETVWKACCYDKAFHYAYYPAKCVVRKVSGPVDCSKN